MAERNWHVVFTKPGKEKKVAAVMAKKKIACYVPEFKSETLIDGRKKMVTSPLFPRFVFVSPTGEAEDVLKKSRHILNFMYWQDRPIQIASGEINAMKSFLVEHNCTHLDRTAVTPGAHHRISNEIQLVRKGSLIEANVGTVKLSLPSLGHVLVAEVRKDRTEEFTQVKDSFIGSVSGS